MTSKTRSAAAALLVVAIGATVALTQEAPKIGTTTRR